MEKLQTVKISEDLHGELKRIALEKKKTLQTLLEDIIKKALKGLNK